MHNKLSKILKTCHGKCDDIQIAGIKVRIFNTQNNNNKFKSANKFQKNMNDELVKQTLEEFRELYDFLEFGYKSNAIIIEKQERSQKLVLDNFTVRKG